MKIHTHEVTLNVYDEAHKLIKNDVSETYVLYPASGKKLKNKRTGITTDTFVGISSKESADDYIEIDKE